MVRIPLRIDGREPSLTDREPEAQGRGLSQSCVLCPGPHTTRGFWALLGAETLVHSPRCSWASPAVAGAQEGQGQPRGLALRSQLSLFEACTCSVSPGHQRSVRACPHAASGLPARTPCCRLGDLGRALPFSGLQFCYFQSMDIEPDYKSHIGIKNRTTTE